ncbi:MAG: DegT/DnrJ/EryC1/StrS family aminotransferase, partial [Candidatus Cloacimonetes bacterium]|nr:DegT/DnrJ/EryC1/StrS family aminotransferase [Candidatus Cloacimonadota bacterium]
HAVGSVYNGKSLLNYGDVSATSFHATKIINTAEGGGCVTEDPQLAEKLRRIRFFGYNEHKDVVEDGFNAKMTEVHAALGILNVNSFDKILADRKHKYMLYKSLLSQIEFLGFQKNLWGTPNYSYFPVIFPSESIALQIIAALESNEIIPRRYFYPSVNTYTNIVTYQPCPISEDISRRILCLPLYYNLTENDVTRVCGVILKALS